MNALTLRTLGVALFTAICVLLTGQASAKTALAICHDGGPGNTKQAAETVDTFLRHTERSAGLEANSMVGEYHTTRAACVAYISKAKPALVVLDLATHLHLAERLGPLAHMGKPDAVSWHLLVREGTFHAPDALSGKAVLAVTPQDPAFIAGIALGAKPDLASSLELSYTSRALKAVRKLAKGKVDAALVDQDTVAFLPELNLPVKLVSVHTSSGLPGLTMSSVNGQAAPDVVRKVKAALPKLCQGEGASLCKTFKVSAFQPAKRSLYRDLAKRYQGK